MSVSEVEQSASKFLAPAIVEPVKTPPQPAQDAPPEYVYIDGRCYEEVVTLIERPTTAGLIWRMLINLAKTLVGLVALFSLFAVLLG